jgi:hypothetical protein
VQPDTPGNRICNHPLLPPTLSTSINHNTTKRRVIVTGSSAIDSAEAKEEHIQLALGDINAGQASFAQAATTYRVGQSTLHNRFHGSKTRQEAHKTKQKLSSRLELSIIQWILFEEVAYHPPTKKQVTLFASNLHRQTGGNGRLSRH